MQIDIQGIKGNSSTQSYRTASRISILKTIVNDAFVQKFSSVLRYIYPKLLQNSNILLVLIIRVCSNISRLVVVNASFTIMNESIPSTFSFIYVSNVKGKLFEKFTDLEVRIKI